MTSGSTSFDTLLTIEGIHDGKMISISRSALMARLIASHLPHNALTGDLSGRQKAPGMDAVFPDFPDDELLSTWKDQRAHFIQRMKAGGSPYLPSEDPEAEEILSYASRSRS